MPTRRLFRFYGGVCRRGIYDNMKTAVEAIFVVKAGSKESSLSVDMLAPFDRAGGLHARLRMEEGSG